MLAQNSSFPANLRVKCTTPSSDAELPRLNPKRFSF